MKKVRGFFIPENDRFFEKMLLDVDEKRMYQQWKLDQALRYLPVKKRGIAIDIGASVGLLSVQLANYFDRVECFEPNYTYCYLFGRNSSEYGCSKKLKLHKMALGSIEKLVSIDEDTQSGLLSGVIEGQTHKQKTLDSFEFENVDFVKIDVEGYELEVLKGAVELLQRENPVLMVEHRGHESRYGTRHDDLFRFLKRLGYEKRKDLKGDYVFTKFAPNTRPDNFDPDKPIAILGGGPSAKGIDLKKLQSRTNLISINDAIKFTPKALAFFTIDGTYFMRSDPLGDFKGPKFISLPYDRFLQLKLNQIPRSLRLDRNPKMELSKDPLIINVGEGYGGSSGRGALNLAWHWGETSNIIYLFGFDGGTLPDIKETHWNRESNHNRWTDNRAVDMNFTFRKTIPQLKSTNTKVINCSLQSKITAFEKSDPHEIIKGL